MAESLAPAARAPMQSRSGQRLLHFLFNSLLPEVTPEQQNQLRAVHANPPEPPEDERGSHGAELKALVAAAETTLTSIDVALQPDSPTQPFDIAAVELRGPSPTAAADSEAQFCS